MKKRIYSLFSACFLFCLSYGSHISGTEIRYTATGNRNFDIFVHVYRECSANTPSAQPLTVQCSSYLISIPASAQTKILVRPVNHCGGTCTGGGNIEEHVWKMSVDLSSYSCCEWLLSHSIMHSRHNGQVYYVEAKLNACVTPKVSFTFEETPGFLTTQNRDVSLNMGITGMTGIDSVSYELTNPQWAMGQSYTYTGNFSPVRPLTFFGFPNQNLQWPAGFRLDQNGYMQFRPTLANQVATIAVKINLWQWVNGSLQLIGYSIRDFEVTNLPHGNDNPQLTHYHPYPAINEVYLCAGDSSLLWMQTEDDDGDSLFITGLTSDSGIVVVTDSLNKSQMLGFRGFPSLADTNGVYSKTVSFALEDKGCPNPQYTHYAFRFRSARKPQMTRALETDCDSARLLMNVMDTVNQRFSYYWNMRRANGSFVGQANNAKPNPVKLVAGTYFAHLSYGFTRGCQVSWDTAFEILPNFRFSIEDPDGLCEDDTARLECVDAGSSGNFNFQWSHTTSSNWIDSGLVAKAWPNSTGYMSLKITDQAGCEMFFQKLLQVVAKPVYGLSQDTLRFCANSFAATSPTSTYMDSMVWSDGVKGKYRNINQHGWHSYKMFNQACVYEDSLFGHAWSAPHTNVSDTLVCRGSYLQPQIQGGTPPYLVQWNNTFSDSFNATVSGSVRVWVRDARYCSESRNFFVSVPDKPTLNFDPPESNAEVCENDSLLVEASGIASGSLLTWNNMKTGNQVYLSAGGNSLKLIDSNGCLFFHLYDIASRPIPDPAFNYLHNGEYIYFIPASIGGQHVWFFGDGDSSLITQPNHDYQGPGDFTVTHCVENVYGCRDTAVQLIQMVGVSDDFGAGLTAYPNPFRQYFRLTFPEKADELVIVDALGRATKTEWQQEGKEVLVRVPVDLSPGAYFVHVFSEGRRHSLELLKR